VVETPGRLADLKLGVIPHPGVSALKKEHGILQARHNISDIGKGGYLTSPPPAPKPFFVDRPDPVGSGSSWICSDQCCGSGMFIPDPTFFHPRSRIRIFSIPNPHQRILSISTPKNGFEALGNMIRVVHPGSGSQIRILTLPIPDPVPDPGVEKAPDPGSGSATLVLIRTLTWDTWGVVSRTPGRGVLDTYVLCCG
jgi:hypothetical protein